MDPELKKLLEKIEDKAQREALEAIFTKLADNNKSLTDEVRKARDARKDAEDKATELEREKAKKDAADLENEKDVEKVRAEMQKQLDKANSKIKTLEGEVSTERSRYHGLASESTINKTLDEHGIKPELKEAALALLTKSHEIKVGDDNSVSIGDKPVSEFIGDWVKSDVGSGFVMPGNRGTSAHNKGASPNSTASKDVKPDWGGTREERKAAIDQQFPELAENSKA